jgi:hypothetical protein
MAYLKNTPIKRASLKRARVAAVLKSFPTAPLAAGIAADRATKAWSDGRKDQAAAIAPE